MNVVYNLVIDSPSAPRSTTVWQGTFFHFAYFFFSLMFFEMEDEKKIFIYP
jgi:hypothetical protein